MSNMRKVWIYKRKGIKGWWVGWYESDKRKAKALPTKTLAEHYHQIKYTQLNSDVFTGTITVDWQQIAALRKFLFMRQLLHSDTLNVWLGDVTQNRLHKTLLTSSYLIEARK